MSARVVSKSAVKYSIKYKQNYFKYCSKLSMVWRNKKKYKYKYITSKLAGTTMCAAGPEDEQSILFETSRPNQLFSEQALTLIDLHMVVPASLPVYL